MEMPEYYQKLNEARKVCNKREIEFAQNYASGLPKHEAYRQAYNASNRKVRLSNWQVAKRCNELLAGPVGHYYHLLMHPYHEGILNNVMLERGERLRMLSQAACTMFKKAQQEQDKGATSTMIKCLHELNKMTGEHAAQELEVQATILSASINTTMTDAQATELYLKNMRGARLPATVEREVVEQKEYEPLKLPQPAPLPLQKDR